MSATAFLINADTGESHPVPPGIVEIGRSAGAAVTVPHVSLSRRHARIFNVDEGFWVEDLGSTNGTFIRGSVVDRPTGLTPGELVQFGDVVFRFEKVKASADQSLEYDDAASLDDHSEQADLIEPLVSEPSTESEVATLEDFTACSSASDIKSVKAFNFPDNAPPRKSPVQEVMVTGQRAAATKPVVANPAASAVSAIQRRTTARVEVGTIRAVEVEISSARPATPLPSKYGLTDSGRIAPQPKPTPTPATQFKNSMEVSSSFPWMWVLIAAVFAALFVGSLIGFLLGRM